MKEFQAFLESVFHDVRTESSVGNTSYKYVTPDRWAHMIEAMVINLTARGYVATASDKEIYIDWSALAANGAE